MADVCGLHLVTNCRGSMSVVYEVSTNLDVTSVLRQTPHMEACPMDPHLAYKMEKIAVLKKRSAEETKPIRAIYDEKASAVPSTSDYFPVFKRVKSMMYSHWSERYQKLPEHRREIPGAFRKTKAGEDLLLWQSASRHIVVFATGNNIRLLGQTKTWGTDGTFKVLPQ
ncbi:hypothetical protein T02_1270 [Trichinella nativa]|uniref:Uncharacterized protein n=1 Tax=Trichinella nativa TaxID=6335 RepID=A0A0V1L9G3_9BILA|nr:hypothetical protein T02_1270 [Trichinella nativa]